MSEQISDQKLMAAFKHSVKKTGNGFYEGAITVVGDIVINGKTYQVIVEISADESDWFDPKVAGVPVDTTLN